MLIGFGVGFGVLCLVAFLLGRLARPYANAPSPPSEQAAGQSLLTATKPVATALPGVGDEIALDGVTLKVTAAENTGHTFSNAEHSVPLESAGMFVWLTVQITNTGSDPIALHAPKLTDSAGREFNPHEDQWLYIPSATKCTLDTLNPGLTKTCSNLFELPTDATGLAAVLKTSLFGDEVRVNLSP